MRRNVYTVKEVNAYIKNMFTQDFMLSRIYIKGEVSNCKYHSSGHIYFSLKDESGTIACVMFAGSRSGLSFRMQEGQQVVALGSISVFERDGRYQLYAKEIMLDGAGQLYEKFVALKKELAEMGMFAAEYKQILPPFIKTLGVVTATTGAVVQDIIQVTKRRNPYVQILIYPAKVQGDGAAESIVSGIEALTEIGVDVMIVGRGGGSMEDLWAFNEEQVAHAIFHCPIPIISAVGHETDTTIADFVADMRAPTPSAAAELAVYEFAAVRLALQEYHLRLQKDMRQKIEEERKKLEQHALRFKYNHPRQKLNDKQQMLINLEHKIRQQMEQKLKDKKHELLLLLEQYKGLSPLYKLKQGYAYVAGSKQENIKSISRLQQGDEINIYMADGRVRAEVLELIKENR
ncbi:MAG: exodeoxyribonuclease VII large subunit [Lachnospiraceae bacterium]|nr:exodeoxyribonuclease VII large subunit [Lachnospiraceae bacterium]